MSYKGSPYNAADDPVGFVKQTLEGMPGYKKQGDADSPPAPSFIGSFIGSALSLELLGYPAWLVIGLSASSLVILYSLFTIWRTIFFLGRPTASETRPNLTKSIFTNPNISFADRVIQFFFPLILPVAQLCWEHDNNGGRAGPTPEQISTVRSAVQYLSDMSYDSILPTLNYTVTTVDLKTHSVLLHTPKPFDPSTPFESLPPLIIWCHGGGLTIGGAKDASLSDFMKLLNDKAVGSTVPPIFASVDYRLSPEHKFPSPIDDVYSTILHFSKTLNITHESIHLAGVSAGAYLTLVGLKKASDSGIKINSVFAQEPMMEFTGEFESEFVNAYTRTCPPRWLKWCWEVFKGEDVGDVYMGLNEEGGRFWKELGKRGDATKIVVSVAAGDPMCGAAEKLVGFMKEGGGKLEVKSFKTRASHACAVCDGEESMKIVGAFADNVFGFGGNEESRKGGGEGVEGEDEDEDGEEDGDEDSDDSFDE